MSLHYKGCDRLTSQKKEGIYEIEPHSIGGVIVGQSGSLRVHIA